MLQAKWTVGLVAVAAVAAAATADRLRWDAQQAPDRVRDELAATGPATDGGAGRSAMLAGAMPPSQMATQGPAGALRPDSGTATTGGLLAELSVGNRGGYLGSGGCRGCHPGAYASWHDSFHRTMTQRAVPAAVQAPFEGNLDLNGVRYTLSRRGDAFWVTLPDPDIDHAQRSQGRPASSGNPLPMVERQIVMVTGSHQMQIFWVASQHYATELRMFPFVYQLREGRWMPYEDSALASPGVARGAVSWNANCIICHTVDGRPGLDPWRSQWAPTRRYDTKAAELGISCEACHGPGEAHARRHHNPAARYGTWLSGEPDPTIVNPAREPVAIQNEICGQCHSSFHAKSPEHQRFYTTGLTYQPGEPLARFRELIRFDPAQPQATMDYYWPDGAARVGGREYLGLLESKCTQAGELSCLSCHSMHSPLSPSDQLRHGVSRDACLQCHADIGRDVAGHTHHAAESSGSDCYNCHMPHTSYALLGGIRSHRIDSPSVSQSLLPGGRLNACNLCHQDQPLAWAAEHLNRWYGQPEWSELTAPEWARQDLSAAALWLLRGDAAQRTLVAWNLRLRAAQQVSGTEWQAPLLAELLDDPYSATRFVAHHSLKELPGFADFEFDFLAAPELRRAARQAALERWQAERWQAEHGQAEHGQAEHGQLGEGAAPERLRRLLLDAAGRPDRARIQQLLQQQDQRPVDLVE